MKEAQFKYFLDGNQVERESIDWGRTLSIIPKYNNEIYVTYMDRPSHRQFDEIKDIERFVDFADSFTFIGSIPYDDNPLISLVDKVSPLQQEFTKMVEEANNGAEVGVKHNKYKAPLDIVQTRQFPKALQLIALATAFGNKKYEETDKDFLNFKRVKGGSQTYFDAAARHNAERNETDEDSGLPHVIHAVWDMLAALEINIEENGIDVKEFSKNYLENLHNPK